MRCGAYSTLEIHITYLTYLKELQQVTWTEERKDIVIDIINFIL
jgi:hypothetical protein